MKKILLVLTLCVSAQAQTAAHWPQWRGPFFNGVARGDAPTVWNDTTNIKWKTQIPGRGFSTPVIWGNRIFVTTAIPIGKPAETPPPATKAASEEPRWTTSRTSIRGAQSRSRYRQNPLAENSSDGNATRRLPSRLRQLRFQLARDGWQVRLCLLRFTRHLLLRLQRKTDLGKRSRCADENAKRVWRRICTAAARRSTLSRFRSRSGSFHRRSR